MRSRRPTGRCRGEVCGSWCALHASVLGTGRTSGMGRTGWDITGTSVRGDDVARVGARARVRLHRAVRMLMRGGGACGHGTWLGRDILVLQRLAWGGGVPLGPGLRHDVCRRSSHVSFVHLPCPALAPWGKIYSGDTPPERISIEVVSAGRSVPSCAIAGVDIDTRLVGTGVGDPLILSEWQIWLGGRPRGSNAYCRERKVGGTVREAQLGVGGGTVPRQVGRGSR
jgi:hypothetical protein